MQITSALQLLSSSLDDWTEGQSGVSCCRFQQWAEQPYNSHLILLISMPRFHLNTSFNCMLFFGAIFCIKLEFLVLFALLL